jgi:hypothetical protein
MPMEQMPKFLGHAKRERDDVGICRVEHRDAAGELSAGALTVSRSAKSEFGAYLGNGTVVSSSRQTGPCRNMGPSNRTKAGTSPMTSQ